MKKQKLEEIRELLVVVDMVNGFVREGVMSDKYIERIIPGHLELFKDFQEPGKQIAFIKDTHKEGCNEFNRYPVHWLPSSVSCLSTDCIDSKLHPLRARMPPTKQGYSNHCLKELMPLQ